MLIIQKCKGSLTFRFDTLFVKLRMTDPIFSQCLSFLINFFFLNLEKQHLPLFQAACVCMYKKRDSKGPLGEIRHFYPVSCLCQVNVWRRAK